jgi:endonuclease YncB( thermonuclease family)
MVHGLRIERSAHRRFWTGIPLAVCILLTVAVCLAATLTGHVVGISDGDTITVLIGGQQAVIRLAGIDAPEHGQAFGSASEEHLRALIFGKNVNLDCGREESYGRLVCKVLLPEGEDVSLDRVKAGMAWQYKQYQSEQSPDDRAKYSNSEDEARENHLGLWADAHPIQPQDFRHGTQSPLCFDKSDHRIACSEQYHGPVRGNIRSHIFHWPSCPNYDEISEGNRVEFPSAAAAEQGGYRAARNCP